MQSNQIGVDNLHRFYHCRSKY